MPTEKNVGKVGIDKGGNWKMSELESPVAPAEFEESLNILEGIILGYRLALEIPEEMYVVGDNLDERTHLIAFKRREECNSKFIRVIQKWLEIPRWNNWRVVLQPTSDKEDFLVIYLDKCLGRQGKPSLPLPDEDKRA